MESRAGRRVLVAENTGNGYNGGHWRVIVDGGNRWNGRITWVAGRASGGGYDICGAAMAEAVRGITGADAGLIDENTSPSTWRERLAQLGWSLLDWGNDFEALALVPSEAVAAEILKDENA